MKSIRCTWHEYRYFPYEKRLAVRELMALLGPDVTVTADDEGVTVEGIVNGASTDALRRLTYFRRVTADDKAIIPDQARRELASRHEGEYEDLELARQSTRYSMHGLHEYRGKFNPQIVNAIANILRLEPGCWLLDPYSGSGTTLLEAAQSGRNAVGVDLNPLAPLIANAKLDAIRAEQEHLEAEFTDVRKRLEHRFEGVDFTSAWTNTEVSELCGNRPLPNSEYLAKWFSEPVLGQFCAILDEIDAADPHYRRILQVALSDIVREVSLQDPGDLRIRRRKEPAPNYPAVPLFVNALSATVDSLAEARAVGTHAHGEQQAHLADARQDLSEIIQQHRDSGLKDFDGGITSPPYASALPYIDTQRLSLALLGLVDASELRVLERDVIGSRELTKAAQAEHNKRIASGHDEGTLSKPVQALCAELLDRSHDPENGFRRKAMPAVIHRYFLDSAAVFRQTLRVMKTNAPLALVVGPNRTTVGGKKFEIDTPMLLSATAEANGWTLVDVEPLETFHRFDVHHRNSIRSEKLIVLRA